MSIRFGLRVSISLAGCVLASAALAAVPVYTTTTHTLVSGGDTRTYLLAIPTPLPAGGAPPLVISLHGDGGSSAGIRADLPLEAASGGKAIFVYPKSAIDSFQYWNDAGRSAEATFITALIAAIDAQIDIDNTRVYLTGFSGGATMANALGCRLGGNVIRKLGIHSGTLYPVTVGAGPGKDFSYTNNGGVTCDLPGAIIVWGTADNSPGTQYPNGIGTLGNHTATQFCSAATTPFGPSPCVAYSGCGEPVDWCAIPGMGHAIWSQAASAMWTFFDADAPAGLPDALWADGFEGAAPPTSSRWVDGYYVGYERALYPVAELDFSGLTHLMVGRLRPLADGNLTRDFDLDTTQGPLWAQSAVDAAHAANRKAILMIGGAGEIDGWRGAATAANRAAFVANLLDAVDDFGADGLDIDWEPIDASDRPNFIALAQALRAARPTLELTLPIGWVNANFPMQGTEQTFLQTIAPLFDQINVMTYDMGVPYDGWQSWFASPLFGETANTPSSVASSITAFRNAGIPAAKLGVGMGFYGNCMQGVTQPRVPVTNAQYVASDGQMSYRNIVATYFPAMTYTYDSAAQAPWLSSAATVGPAACNFVTYENPTSIAAKGAYVVDQGLGGGIIWTIGQGHVPTLPAGQRDPLLDAVREAFLQ